MFSSTNEKGDFTVPVIGYPIKADLNPTDHSCSGCSGNNHTLGKTMQLINTKVPTAVVRMAIYSLEMQGVHVNNANEACYLPSNGTGPKVSHTAPISSDTFSGIDVYYRRKDKAVFILTKTRALRLSVHPTKPRLYYLKEDSFLMKDCMLAHMTLDQGRIGNEWEDKTVIVGTAIDGNEIKLMK